MAQPVSCDLPTPRTLQAARSRKLNALFENGPPASRGYLVGTRARTSRAASWCPCSSRSGLRRSPPVQLLYPTSRHLAPQVRAAVELLMDRFAVYNCPGGWSMCSAEGHCADRSAER